jgi:hypothetical protein
MEVLMGKSSIIEELLIATFDSQWVDLLKMNATGQP